MRATQPSMRRFGAGSPPKNAIVRIAGAVEKVEECGDGIRAFISGNRTALGAWQIEFGATVRTDIESVAVEAGDAIDFIIDCGEQNDFLCDGFRWAIRIEQIAGDEVCTWDAARDFGGKVTKPDPLTPWEQLAQALLLSNEFLFID